ncbi:MAG TPA: hypothetical protein VIV60_30560 [Polyangiaceae bacterium]
MAEDTQKEVQQSVSSYVAKWTAKIQSAKRKHEAAFKQMREDMKFVGGIQWVEQQDLQSEKRYINNLVMRAVNQSVDALYARNPRAVARRRERLDYRVWDGQQDSLVGAAQVVGSGLPDPVSLAILHDYIQGQQFRKLLDRLAKTFEIAYQIQIDRLEPNFKLQMKQLVRRIKVAGVGYVKAVFRRESRLSIPSTQSDTPIIDRAKKIAALVEEYNSGKFDDTSDKMQQLEMLMLSVNYSQQNPAEVTAQDEKLLFEFPRATSIIVDPACTILKGFVGANWIAQEYIIDIDDIQAMFGKKDATIQAGVKQYTPHGEEVPPAVKGEQEGEHKPKGCVWEVWHKPTRSHFFLMDGYKDFLLPPQEPRPCVQRFWPVMSITFNDIETDLEDGLSVYPPSDVRLMRCPQQEWNRSREGLRQHRRSNRPKYITGVDWLDTEDKENLKNPPNSAVIELRGLKPGENVNDKLVAFQHAPIDPALYDTLPLEKDILVGVGVQQANMGPITAKGTATEATISEQSRISTASSNVDDLDELLSEMATVGGEMMLREMSKAAVVRDVGPGAVWPEIDRDKYVDRIFLEVQAASTGRPNQGLRIAHIREIAPLLLQAGANPQFVIEEIVKAYDERIDVQRAFPVVPQQVLNGAGLTPPMPSDQANGSPAGPPVPLPAQTDAGTAAAGLPSQ